MIYKNVGKHGEKTFIALIILYMEITLISTVVLAMRLISAHTGETGEKV